MPIDTSIYQNMLRPPKSVAEYDAEAMQGQQNRLALQMGQQKADEYTRGVSDSNRLRGVVSGFGEDKTANYNALLGAGRLTEAQNYQKTNADAGKTAAESAHLAGQTQKDKFSVIVQANGLVGSAAGAIMQNPDYNHAIGVVTNLKAKLGPELSAQLGLDTLQIPQDPAALKAWANDHYLGSVDTGKQLDDARIKSEGLANRENQVTITKMTNDTSRSNNAATVGASYANAGATRAVAQATRDAAGIQRDQATEMKMADDYRAQSKDFKAVSDAYRQINSTLDKATTSPAATLAAATKFMKLLDPGSVVRESELGMALAATGIFDRATNYFNTLQSGRVLTANQVKDFKNITEQIYGAAKAGQQSIDANYTKQAQTLKLRPEMIVQDLGQNAKSGVPDDIAALLNKHGGK